MGWYMSAQNECVLLRAPYYLFLFGEGRREPLPHFVGDGLASQLREVVGYRLPTIRL